MPPTDVYKQFGEIDIYLFDQLLRGRILPGMRILDAGCGYGRNLIYLLLQGYDVFGVDQDAASIHELRGLTARLAPQLPADHFQIETIERMSLPDAFSDFVICNAVLHFAQDDDQFDAMLNGCWRVLKPGGILFCRLASSIGLEKRVQRIGRGKSRRRFLLPDGSERYLVDESLLNQKIKELDARMIDPLKSTIVQNERCMSTWVLQKTAAGK